MFTHEISWQSIQEIQSGQSDGPTLPFPRASPLALLKPVHISTLNKTATWMWRLSKARHCTVYTVLVPDRSSHPPQLFTRVPKNCQQVCLSCDHLKQRSKCLPGDCQIISDIRTSWIIKDAVTRGEYCYSLYSPTLPRVHRWSFSSSEVSTEGAYMCLYVGVR